MSSAKCGEKNEEVEAERQSSQNVYHVHGNRSALQRWLISNSALGRSVLLAQPLS